MKKNSSLKNTEMNILDIKEKQEVAFKKRPTTPHKSNNG